ncbi:MAG: GTPase [Lachnospiraceae bacterium]|nr:GTPase [Lachnospiraceae bacterium]
MIRKREIPVYLFTGFLESGKTTFIKETLLEGEFEDGARTLYISCEEGMEELEQPLLDKNKITAVEVEDEDDLNTIAMKKWEEEHRPQRILIEFNGTWDLADFMENKLPPNWFVVQVITTIDASTYEVYLGNMKMMMLNQFKESDLVVFNRCEADIDRGKFRRSVKAVNRKAQIIYENADGTVDQNFEEQMPFDTTGPEIEIVEEDFGLWYIHAMDHPEIYEGKYVTFKGMFYKPKSSKQDLFVPGRFAMTCCADDIAFIGFVCHGKGIEQFRQKDWVKVRAQVRIEYCKDYKGKGPVLYAESVEPDEPAQDELVYFT